MNTGAKKASEEEAFRRSKIVFRTPVDDNKPRGEKHVNMAKIEALITDMSKEMKDIRIEMQNTRIGVKTDNEMKMHWDEIRSTKEELIERELEWERDKNVLKSKIEHLEKRIKNQEKNNRKNNIVIKRLQLQNENLRETVEEICKHNARVKLRAEMVHKSRSNNLNPGLAGVPPPPQARPQYKLTPNMRNAPFTMPPQQALVVQGQEPLTATMLAAAPLQEQKQMLGERLFPMIQRSHPDRAGKITGMLLEIDNSELLHMLEHPEALKTKVEEAIAVLQAHQAKTR